MSLPSVPPQLKFDLEFFLTQLRNSVLALEKQVGGGDDQSGDGGLQDSGSSGGFEPVYESPVVLAGVGESLSTEDAWTTVASGAPAESRYAIVQFYLFSDTDSADGQISWRTESGAAEIVACVIHSDEADAEGQTRIPWYFVKLTASGDFDYKTDTTAGTLDWELRRIGYVL